MAAGTKLVLTFGTSGDDNATFTYSYAKPGAGAAAVKALMNGMIANGSIFGKVPVTAKSAKEVTTSETVYDLSA